MIFNQDRQQMRQFFAEAWRKYRAQLALEPLETIIADIISKHPEYHAVLEDSGSGLERDYSVESGQANPFLHMGMHIAIQEQLTSNRPHGIVGIYHSLLGRIQDAHEVDHLCLECLGEMLWHAQRDGVAPDETQYLNCLQKLANKAS